MASVKKTSLLSYISVVFYLLAGFLYTPFLVKTLGVSDYGIYSLSASLIGYFSLDFGIGAAQARLAAKYNLEGRRDKLRDMLGITTRIFAFIDFVILLLLLVVYFNADVIFSNLTDEELVRFKNVFIITGLFVLVNFPLLPTKGLYQAFDRVYEVVVIDLCNKVVSVSLLVGALCMGWGLYGVVVIGVLCNIVTQLFKLFYIRRAESLSINIKANDKEITGFLASFSMWATVAMIADKFFFGIIPFLLAAFANTREVAIFAIVISLEGYVLSISKSLNGIFLPRVMKLVVDHRDGEAQTRLMVRVGRIQLLIVGFLVTGAISLGREFIHHWLGTEFDKSYFCMILVLFPCLFHLTQTIAEELVFATNNVKYRAIAYVTGSLLSVSSIVLLSPEYGAYGAAIGVCLSFVVAHNLIMDVFYQKKMGLNMLYFFRQCHVRMLPSFLLSGALGWCMCQYIHTETFLSFLVKAVVWGALTLVLLWLFAINREEKKMFIDFVK